MSIKEQLITSVKKVYLDLSGVEDYYIFWDSKSNNLLLASYVIAHKTSTLCHVSLKGAELDSSKVILRDPDKFLKLLAIADDDFQIFVNISKSNKIKICDKSFESEFVLCDPASVNVKIPKIDEPTSYEASFNLTEAFILKYIAAKKANNSEIFSVEIEDCQTKFELGDNNNYSNKIKFVVEMEGASDMDKLLFSSDVIEEIFNRNKGSQGKMWICEQGLMKIVFENNNIESKYFLIALDKL